MGRGELGGGHSRRREHPFGRGLLAVGRGIARAKIGRKLETNEPPARHNRPRRLPLLPTPNVPARSRILPVSLH